jgi:hypothetical protein
MNDLALFDDNGYPGAHARRTDPRTSHAAAASVDVTAGQQHVLDLLAAGPATDEDLVARARTAGILISDSGVRSRRAELVRAGRVTEAGIGTTTSGRKSTVWAVL